jgi:hypothetical protein
LETVNKSQTFCWWCGKKLKLPYHSSISDPIGNVHKVHVKCKAEVIEDMKPEPMFAVMDEL